MMPRYSTLYVAAVKRDLETVRAEVSAAKAELTTASAEIVLAKTQLADLEKADAEVQASLSRATARTEELGKERDQLQQGNQALAQGRNADYEKTLLEANARYDQLKVKAAQLERERDGLLKSGAELSKTVTSLTADKRALEGRVEELSMAAEALKVRQERELAETRSAYESLVGELKGEIAQGQVQISQIQGKLTVNVADTIFFDSGRAEIKDSGRKVLQRVGDILKHIPDKGIRIEGHTDNLQIRGALKERFPTNWELSTGRAKNRRIEIVIIDKELLRPPPVQPQTP